MVNNKHKLIEYGWLVISCFFYTAFMLLSKQASGLTFLSYNFLLAYSMILIASFLYATCWQRVLKEFSLTTAYSSKSIQIIIAMVFGKCFYGDPITLKMIIGSILIFVGVIIMVKNNE